VYRQFGTDSELAGTSTTDSLTVNNLVPGTAHTFNVLARDQAGYLSAPSAPVRVVTGLVGANDGAFPSPAAISLNGTVCTTTYSS
jgi:hypothetical protein